MNFFKKLFSKQAPKDSLEDQQKNAIQKISNLSSNDKTFIETENERLPSTLIAVDLEQKTVMLRTPSGFCESTDEVEVFAYGKSPIKFKTKVLAVRNGYLVLSIPLLVEEAQKRKHFRVPVLTERVEASLIIMGSKRFEMIPVDLSIGGAHLEIRGRLNVARDALVTLCLQLEDEPLLPIKMFIANSNFDSKKTDIRGSFYSIEPEDERKLSKWLLDVQRRNKK